MTACGGAGSTGTTAIATVPTTAAPATTTTTAMSTTSTFSATSSTSTPASSTTVRVEGEAQTFELQVAADVVTGGGRLRTQLGAPVTLVVVADVSDEIHVHGYDLSKEVAPGQPATIEFIADIPGVFEVELEEAGLELAELEVSP